MRRPLHILFVCNEYPPARMGGIGATVACLARGLAAHGHRVEVIGFSTDNRLEQDQGVTIHRLKPPRRHLFPLSITARLALNRAIRTIHRASPLDVIEWPDYEGWFWSPIPGVTDVVKVHGTHMSHRLQGLAPRRRIVEAFELRTLRRNQNWIGVSRWFIDEWRTIANVVPERETVIYNPFDSRLFYPGKGERLTRTVLYAGGFKKRKGVQSLASAARLFLAELPDARLVLIGFDADMTASDIRRLAGHADRVAIHNFLPQKEVASWMQRATVYAMPSLYESCGNSWIEAMACGLPVVGSHLSCGPEIVKDGITGLLANPHSPRDVADKIIYLLRDREFAEHLARRAYENALERFTLESAVSKSEAFYYDCRDADL